MRNLPVSKILPIQKVIQGPWVKAYKIIFSPLHLVFIWPFKNNYWFRFFFIDCLFNSSYAALILLQYVKTLSNQIRFNKAVHATRPDKLWTANIFTILNHQIFMNFTGPQMAHEIGKCSHWEILCIGPCKISIVKVIWSRLKVNGQNPAQCSYLYIEQLAYEI